MIYGGEPLKPLPPAKVCNTQTMGLHGPEAYSYGLLAKQPGSDYKIRMRDMERNRLAQYNANLEKIRKNTNRQNRQMEMIEVADKKFFYNKIKKMVDEEIKANEHLFREECPKQDLEENEKKPEVPKLSIEEKQAILEESKRKNDEEARNTVKEKLQQHFIENSDKLRIAAVSHRQRVISDLNHKTIQEKEIMIKAEKIKKRQLANSENTELFKSQLHEKEEKERKQFEQKEQYRKELRMQLEEKEKLREQEHEFKIIERNDMMKLKKTLEEEIEFEKQERIRNRTRVKEETTQLIEDRIKIFSKINEMRSDLNNTFITTYRDYSTRDAAFDHCEPKAQVRRENDVFMKHYLTIKEERKKQEDEKSRIQAKQIKEIEDLKLLVERQNDESRRKRFEEGNKIIMEQLKASEVLVEQQKEIKREVYEESVKNHENYLKDLKEMCEKNIQKKLKFRKDLKDQIDTREHEMKQQKVIEMEKHRKYMLELAKQEELLQKLLKEVSLH